LGKSKRAGLHLSIREGSSTEPALSVSPDTDTVQSRVPLFGAPHSGAGTDGGPDVDPLDEGGPEGDSPAGGKQEDDEAAKDRDREDSLARAAILEADNESAVTAGIAVAKEEDAARAVQ